MIRMGGGAGGFGLHRNQLTLEACTLHIHGKYLSATPVKASASTYTLHRSWGLAAERPTASLPEYG